MSGVRRVAGVRVHQHDVDDVTADDRAFLRDMGADDHEHVRVDRHRPRRLRAVARPGRPGLAAPGSQVALLVALEGGWRETGAERILLPPLGAPPVDRTALDVLPVADYERTAARRVGQPDHDHRVRLDRAGEVGDRRAVRVGPGNGAAVAEWRLAIGIRDAVGGAAVIGPADDGELYAHVLQRLRTPVGEGRGDRRGCADAVRLGGRRQAQDRALAWRVPNHRPLDRFVSDDSVVGAIRGVNAAGVQDLAGVGVGASFSVDGDLDRGLQAVRGADITL